MKKRTINWFNYDPNKVKNETPRGESLTVPDEAISIKELLEKWTMGYEVPRKEAFYSNSDDFDDIDPTQLPDFDLSDAVAETRRITDKISEHKARKQKAETKAENVNGTGDGSEADVTQPADV